MNIKNKNHLKFYFLSFTAILILSFIVLYPSFNLAFEDEEWQGVVLPKTIYSNYVTSKVTAYSSPMWFMTNLYTWLGPNFSIYFILSFILRNLVALSVLVFLYMFTKNKLTSFLGGSLVVVGFSGIQTTFEVINMISYISYIGYLVFLIGFFLILEKFSYKYLITMVTSLLITTAIASFRVYPLYAWVFVIDGFRLLMHFKKDLVKFFLMRQVLISVVFLLLYKIGFFSWFSRDVLPGNSKNDFTNFISIGVSSLLNLNFNIISNFLKGLGNIIFPNILDKTGSISFSLGVFYIVILIGLFIYLLKRRTKDLNLLFDFLLWPLIFYASYFLVYMNGQNSKDTAIFLSNIRYMFPPFIGFSIALAIFLSIILKKKNKLNRIILAMAVAFIFFHSLTTHSYLNKLSQIRDGAYMVKIWNQIKQLVPESSLSSEKMNVFYFETDGSARAIYTVNDGFIGHAIALYKIDSKPPKFDSTEISAFGRLLAPPIITFEELVSYIAISLSYNPEPDIWNRIFALRVEGYRVIDIKEDVRRKVEASLNK